jgi:hypothetical protein
VRRAVKEHGAKLWKNVPILTRPKSIAYTQRLKLLQHNGYEAQRHDLPDFSARFDQGKVASCTI